MRPTHIEDYLVKLHNGQWFGWSNSINFISTITPAKPLTIM